MTTVVEGATSACTRWIKFCHHELFDVIDVRGGPRDSRKRLTGHVTVQGRVKLIARWAPCRIKTQFDNRNPMMIYFF